jgi:hypothetical protein
MAGAVAEAGATEKAATILKTGLVIPSRSHHAVALVLSRDTPMRTTRCHSPGLPLKLQAI